MIAFDYLIANEDRHWNNFGLLRNSETLEYVGIAPLYDHEYSMQAAYDFETRTFTANPRKELSLIAPENKIMPSDDLLEETWDEVYSGDLGEKKLRMCGADEKLEQKFTKPELIAYAKDFLPGRAERLRAFDRNKEKREENSFSSFQMYTR